MTALAATKGLFVTDSRSETQAITSLSFQPRAVIAWWTRQDGEGVAANSRGGLGFWSDNGTVSVAWVSDSLLGPTTATAHVARRAALVGLEARQPSVCMEAELASFGPGGFTLRWTTPPREAWQVHFLALGGSSLQNASVGWLTSPTSPGHQTLELPEIEPDLVLFAASALKAVSDPVRGLSAGIGAASKKGQAAAAYALRSGVKGGAVVGIQRTDKAILVAGDELGTSTTGAVRTRRARAHRIECSQVDATPRLSCYLALEGLRCRVGTTVAPGSPAMVRARVGFRPEALLFFSWGLPASTAARNIGRLCIGGASAGGAGGASWDDINVEGRPLGHVCSSEHDVVIVTDTQTGDFHAVAALDSIDDKGFTLNWRESDRVGRQVVYVALAAKHHGAGDRLRRWAQDAFRSRA